MKKLKNFKKFNINESQSKKIREYIDFSTFLDWFNKNRAYIAKILDCDINDIISEEELLKQSSELIDNVINPQIRGNIGRSVVTGDIELTGFKQFNMLKNKIIHDILHNIYNVTEKEFSKDEYDFTESEYIEEIEVLAIEESFVKYFTKDLDYVKPDFINQNINRLVSFLMMSIIREDGERIVKILDGEIEPYIKVYDKIYPIKNTPFQNLYEIFKFIPIDPVNDKEELIKDGQDFKDWLGYMVLYGKTIDNNSGADRSFFPDFLGYKNMEDFSDEEFEEYLNMQYYYVYELDDLNGAICSNKIRGYVVFVDEPITEVDEIWEEYVTYYTGIDSLDNLPENVKDDIVENRLITDEIVKYSYIIEYENEDIDTKYIPWQASIYFENSENIKYIVETAYDDDDTKNFYVYDYDGEFLYMKKTIWDNVDLDKFTYKVTNIEYDFLDNRDEYIIDIDTDNYNYSDDLESNIRQLFYSPNGKAITRRYFRYNDVLVNNTKINIEPKNNYYKPIKNTLFDDYLSLSKHLITDNSKKLTQIFDTFRGWSIKNIDKLKKTHKQMNRLFSIEDLNLLNNFPKFFEHGLKKYKNILHFESTLKFNFFHNYENYENFINDVKMYQKLFKKITNDKDIFTYLKRLPSIKDINLLNKYILEFEDIFSHIKIKKYEKNINIINKINSLNIKDIIEYLLKIRKVNNNYPKIVDFGYTNINQLLNDILIYVKNILGQDVKIITKLRFHTNRDGIIDTIFVKMGNNRELELYILDNLFYNLTFETKNNI